MAEEEAMKQTGAPRWHLCSRSPRTRRRGPEQGAAAGRARQGSEGRQRQRPVGMRLSEGRAGRHDTDTPETRRRGGLYCLVRCMYICCISQSRVWPKPTGRGLCRGARLPRPGAPWAAGRRAASAVPPRSRAAAGTLDTVRLQCQWLRRYMPHHSSQQQQEGCIVLVHTSALGSRTVHPLQSHRRRERAAAGQSLYPALVMPLPLTRLCSRPPWRVGAHSADPAGQARTPETSRFRPPGETTGTPTGKGERSGPG